MPLKSIGDLTAGDKVVINATPVCVICRKPGTEELPLVLSMWVEPINEQFDAGLFKAVICDNCSVVHWAYKVT